MYWGLAKNVERVFETQSPTNMRKGESHAAAQREMYDILVNGNLG